MLELNLLARDAKNSSFSRLEEQNYRRSDYLKKYILAEDLNGQLKLLQEKCET